MGRESRLKAEGLKNATYQHADGTWKDFPPEGFDGMGGFKVEVKAYGFVTNPGEPGWVDPEASSEVQEQQREERKRLAAEWTEKAMALEAQLEGV